MTTVRQARAHPAAQLKSRTSPVGTILKGPASADWVPDAGLPSTLAANSLLTSLARIFVTAVTEPAPRSPKHGRGLTAFDATEARL